MSRRRISRITSFDGSAWSEAGIRRERSVKTNAPKVVLGMTLMLGVGGVLYAAIDDTPPSQEAVGVSTVDVAPRQIEVTFLTNRAPATSDDGEAFFGNSLGDLSGGKCRVQLSEAAPEPSFQGAVREEPGATFDRIASGGDAGVVLYIHGYYEDFERACRRAAILQDGLDIDAQFLLFTWPANSTPLTYGADVDDLKASVPDIDFTIRSLATRIGRNRLSIIAHSLGSRGLLWALEQGPDTVLPEGERFRDLILVAADVDRDRFLAVLPSVRGRFEEFVVLVSDRDLPLRASQVVNRGTRLGQATDLEDVDIDVIDVSNLDATHFSGHIYHLRNDDVIAMLRRILVRPADVGEGDQSSSGALAR